MGISLIEGNTHVEGGINFLKAGDEDLRQCIGELWTGGTGNA